MGMCLFCSLVGTTIMKSASILLPSFLRNLKRAGTKAVSSRGDGNGVWVWKGNSGQSLILLEVGVVCVRTARKLGECGREVKSAIWEDLQVTFSVNDDTNDEEGNMRREAGSQGKVI